jgi:Zn-dependent protease
MSDTVTIIAVVIPVMIISITLHELMHALVGLWLGDPTAKYEGRISLNPINHIDPVLTLALPLLLALLGLPIFAVAKPVQINSRRLKFDEWGMALVAAAGPLTNLAIAVISAMLLNSLNWSGFGGKFLFGMVEINVGLFIFNSIPWPPLDGSRILYALAPPSVQEFMMRVEQAGFTGLILFMFFFSYVLSSPINTLIVRLTNHLLL